MAYNDALRAGILSTASALGMNPVDLATIISYETAGTFDPRKRGPVTQWGQHEGLIQFGQPQQERFGVDLSNPDAALASQLGPDGAIVKYFRAHGWQPGMSGLDAYSIVNAGAPGRYNASDANNGGAPGSVRDKWEKQMAGHRVKAQRLLGDMPSQNDPAPQVGINYTPPSADSMSRFNPSLATDVTPPAAAPTPAPKWNEPGGLLSQIGGFLMGSAQAEPMDVPALNPPASFGASGYSDPLGLQPQGEGNGNGNVMNADQQRLLQASPMVSAPAQQDGYTLADILPSWGKALTGGDKADPWFMNEFIRIGPFTGTAERNRAADERAAELRRGMPQNDANATPAGPAGWGSGSLPQAPAGWASGSRPSAPPGWARPARPVAEALPPAPNNRPGRLSDEFVRPQPQQPASDPMQGPPMPVWMRPDFQGPPMPPTAPQQDSSVKLPETAPIPTPRPKNPNKKPFDTIGFLSALGPVAAALGGNSPDVSPVSLNPPVHRPDFAGLPMPPGLLDRLLG